MQSVVFGPQLAGLEHGEDVTCWIANGGHSMVNPDQIRPWIRVVRDALLILFGSAIVIEQLTRNFLTGDPPNVTWLGFAAFLFGLVPAFRLDEWLFKGGRNGNGGGKNGGP